MTHTFYKYQGTGNDFIIMDNRQQEIDKNDTKRIAELCDRRFGIGADGLILLENHDAVDFKMVYFNADGNESSMCGNGGRCITHFAQYLGVIENSATFEAVDGMHDAIIDASVVKLHMQNVSLITDLKGHVVLDTGSPHFVKLKKDVDAMNVDQQGAAIRYSEDYKAEGINVNFVEKKTPDTFSVRTYERGVEAETLSCGTGVTAVALAMHYLGETKKHVVNLHTQGGHLQVSFKKEDHSYTDIWLIGPATQVFKGEISW